MEHQPLIMWASVGCLALLFPLIANLRSCYKAILNDARIISRDPALQSNFEVLYAYPGFWALFWYRLSHALLQQKIPVVSDVLPRLAMSVVRYATAIDIHPAAQISGGGILIDHGTGLVVGATAIIGAGVTLYHGVTLGNSGRKVPPGGKRHPTIGDRVVIGAGAKVLGDIIIGDDVLIGANSVLTKPVPSNHTAVGVPARVLCHGAATGKNLSGAAICQLHQPLQKVQKGAGETIRRPSATASTNTPTTPIDTAVINTNATTDVVITPTTFASTTDAKSTSAITPTAATAATDTGNDTGTDADMTATATTAATTTANGTATAVVTQSEEEARKLSRGRSGRVPPPTKERLSIAELGAESSTSYLSSSPGNLSGPAVSGPVARPIVWAPSQRGQGSSAPVPRGVVVAEELRSDSAPPSFALAKAAARGVAAAPAPAAAAVAAAAVAAEAAESCPPSDVKTSFSTVWKRSKSPVAAMKPSASAVKPSFSAVKQSFSTNVKPFPAVKPFSTKAKAPLLPVFVAGGGDVWSKDSGGEAGRGGEGRLGGEPVGRSESIRDIMHSLGVLAEENTARAGAGIFVSGDGSAQRYNIPAELAVSANC